MTPARPPHPPGNASPPDPGPRRLRDFLRAKIREPIVLQLTQGLSPEKVALTVAVGLCIAVIPVVGATTILCFLAAWALRLNQPIIQAINWSSYALQLLLIYPFIRLGEAIFGARSETRSLRELLAMGRADPLGTVATLGTTVGHAVVAWMFVAPLIVGGIYFGTLPLFRALTRRASAARAKTGEAARAAGDSALYPPRRDSG